MKMFKLMVLILLFSNQSHNNDMELERMVCGFEPKCAGDQTYIQRKDTSCCLYCGCNDICVERNTCCWNKPMKKLNSKHYKQECLQSVYKPTGMSKNIPSDSYYTRTRCPDAYKNNTVKKKCESIVPGSIEEVRFVSSKDGKVVYKNRFCGLCHGENNTVAWEMVFPAIYDNKKCKNVSSIPNDNIQQMTNYIFLHCIISFIRPRNIDVRSVFCFDKTKVISQCNVTGRWDLYNKDLENLCLSVSTSVYVDTPFDFTYTNPYCYLCNTVTKHSPCFRSFDRNAVQYFLKLVDYEIWTANTGVLSYQSKEICTTDEIMDTFFNRCRRLFCPQYTVPFSGKCITFLDFGQCTVISVRLVLGSYVNQSETIIGKIGESAFEIQRTLGLINCFACSISMYHLREILKYKEEDIIIELCLQTTSRCSNEYLWAKLADINSKGYVQFNLKLNGNRTRFQIITLNDSFSKSELLFIDLITLSDGLCRESGREQQLLCSKVQLSMTEYKTVVKTHINSEKLISAPDKADKNETIFVCCHNYITKQHSGAYQLNVLGGNIFTLILTFNILLMIYEY